MEDIIDTPDRILTEQTNVLYKYLFPILIINLLIGGALVYGLLGVVPEHILITWGLAGLLVIAFRALAYIYARHGKAKLSIQKQALIYTIGAGGMGLLWGLGAVAMVPEVRLEYQLFILLVLASMGAGAASSYHTYLPAFFVYFPSSLLPVSFVLFSQDSSIHISLGIMAIAYSAVVSFFAISMNRSFLQTLNLRYENLDLVEQLKAQKDEAEQANIAKSRFLAAASHDLRQPLHALVLFTSVLDETIQNTKSRHVLEQVKSSISALQNLFNALLDISKLEAGVMLAEKVDFNIGVLFEKIKNDFQIAAAEKNLRLKLDNCDYYVNSDPALLEQILRNYIANAINYTEQGSVFVCCEEETNRIRIDIRDTGIGIAADKQQSIFEEFYQVGNQERDRRKGLGLGLAIVQRVAKLLEHEIKIASKLGEGSVFTVYVDRVEKPTTSNAIIEPEIRRETKLADGLNIIVIDDEISAQQGMCSLLESWNCSAFAFSNAADAISEVEKANYKPDGIITDFRLTDGKTGLDAIQQLHEKFGNHIPALVITGDTANKCLLEVQEKGYQLLHKPVQPIKLRAFLQHLG